MTATERIRFYTENVEGAEREIAWILTAWGITGATLYTARGMWDCKYENSLVVEVLNLGHVNQNTVEAIAEAIKCALKQQAVLITKDVVYTQMWEGYQ